MQDLKFTNWLQNYTSNDALFSSDIKGNQICVGFASRVCTWLDFTNSSDVLLGVDSSLLQGHYFIFPTFLNNETWMGGSLNTANIKVEPIIMDEIMGNGKAKVIYSNGRNLLIAP
jgi:hypothetical protein